MSLSASLCSPVPAAIVLRSRSQGRNNLRRVPGPLYSLDTLRTGFLIALPLSLTAQSQPGHSFPRGHWPYLSVESHAGLVLASGNLEYRDRSLMYVVAEPTNEILTCTCLDAKRSCLDAFQA